jgi:hypothetical protein
MMTPITPPTINPVMKTVILVKMRKELFLLVPPPLNSERRTIEGAESQLCRVGTVLLV